MAASTAHWPTPSTSNDDAQGSENRASRPRTSFWHNVGYLTSLGWMIALPIGLGVIAGRLLDDHFNSGSFWTLALLGAGVAIGVLELLAAVRSALERASNG